MLSDAVQGFVPLAIDGGCHVDDDSHGLFAFILVEDGVEFLQQGHWVVLYGFHPVAN